MSYFPLSNKMKTRKITVLIYVETSICKKKYINITFKAKGNIQDRSIIQYFSANFTLHGLGLY